MPKRYPVKLDLNPSELLLLHQVMNRRKNDQTTTVTLHLSSDELIAIRQEGNNQDLRSHLCFPTDMADIGYAEFTAADLVSYQDDLADSLCEETGSSYSGGIKTADLTIAQTMGLIKLVAQAVDSDGQFYRENIVETLLETLQTLDITPEQLFPDAPH